MPLWYRILNSFNLFSNINKLLTTKKESQPLDVLNAIRVISFFQIVLGHEYALHLGGTVNLLDMGVIVKKAFMTIIFSCYNAVDVFLFLGGFLVAYILCD